MQKKKKKILTEKQKESLARNAAIARGHRSQTLRRAWEDGKAVGLREKTLQLNDTIKALDEDKKKRNSLTFMFHKDYPKGKTFSLMEAVTLDEGWFDHPNKIKT